MKTYVINRSFLIDEDDDPIVIINEWLKSLKSGYTHPSKTFDIVRVERVNERY
jgi:hypothetical protein